MKERKATRVFLAIELPSGLLRNVAEIQNQLKIIIKGNVRWVNPSNIHMTVKFLGDVFNEDLEKISNTLRICMKNISPFSLEAGKIGIFPNIKRPRIIWLGIGGDMESLLRFQVTVDKELRKCGFKPEERHSTPHLTIARIKETKELIGLEKILEKRDNYNVGHFDVRGLTFFASNLTPQGAVYTKLEHFPFIT